MSAAYIDGKWACYSTTDGIRKHYLGCRHDTPKQQIAHTSGSYVSPRRSGSAVSPSDRVAPLPGEGSTALPEPQGSRLLGQGRQ